MYIKYVIKCLKYHNRNYNSTDNKVNIIRINNKQSKL